MSHSTACLLLDALTFAALVALGMSFRPVPRKLHRHDRREDGQKP